MISIVVGAGFGDEGKGSVVNQLITDPNTIIVRFNGGHQVGHTVVKNGTRHVFSNFGSGSLTGIPTYWSEYCTIHPLGIINEYKVLKDKGYKPTLYIDPLCPVVTPFDIMANQQTELQNKHGSVGVGFGTTIGRHTQTPLRLFAQDLLCKPILIHKLIQIFNFYGINTGKDLINEFIDQVENLFDIDSIYIGRPKLNEFKDIIFEGGQGILLDQDFGFFPHVTRSNTTSKNAIEIIKKWNLENEAISVLYITRPYLTRHGNGPLPFEKIGIEIKHNPNETNVSHLWQHEFRIAPLNIDLLNYSISCDRIYSSDLKNVGHYLYVTCVDQLINERLIVIKDEVITPIQYNNLVMMIIGVNGVISKGYE